MRLAPHPPKFNHLSGPLSVTCKTDRQRPYICHNNAPLPNITYALLWPPVTALLRGHSECSPLPVQLSGRICVGRDLDVVELHGGAAVLCLAAAAITTMQFQPKRDGLLVITPPSLAHSPHPRFM